MTQQRIYKILSIDESGKASYEHHSSLFILSGILISENFRPKLDTKIRNLKKKFFKDEEVVFHSRDMSRKKGPFAILREVKIETNFWAELISILNDPEILMIFIISDKNKAKKIGWQPKTILKRSYLRLLELFHIQLNKDQSKGKIIAESDSSQDTYLIEAHSTQQSQNQNYRQSITSLCLVQKSNLDSDIQMADALAPIAGMLFSKTRLANKIEKMKANLIERKLLNKQNPSYLESLI